MKNSASIKRILTSLLAAAVLCTSLVACNNNNTDNNDDKSQTENITSGAEEEIKLPENENKKEEIIINENYADSELISFEGTVDEIYEDGSMLVYSPFFGPIFNYFVIVELDDNSVTDGFELKTNQCVKFDVYSSVKKSEPLTVVASKLTLVDEVSTQRQQEAERQQEIQDNLDKYLQGKE